LPTTALKERTARTAQGRSPGETQCGCAGTDNAPAGPAPVAVTPLTAAQKAAKAAAAHGAPQTPPSDLTPELRYALIFRLNRDPYRKRDGYGVVRDPRGNFSLFGTVAFYFDVPIERLEIRNCFIGYIDAERTGFIARLDALSLGARVPVRLRPLTPKPNGTSVLGRAYRRNPRLLSTDYALASPGARELRRIGCPITRSRLLRQDKMSSDGGRALSAMLQGRASG
jgi:hypothetical protein